MQKSNLYKMQNQIFIKSGMLKNLYVSFKIGIIKTYEKRHTGV